MKRTRIRFSLLGASAIALVLWFTFSSRQQKIRSHTSGWHSAMLHLANSTPVPLPQRLLNNADTPGQYWHEVARYHEKALIKLGYLTNCEFHLTNQVMTRAFSSNFFWLIQQRLGTNTDQVWMCPSLTNNSGIRPTLPVKDVAAWEQTFRECAARYASNLSATVTTNSGQ
jgi:hypothetical protein